MTGRIEVLAVAGLPEVRPGDDLAALIAGAVDLVDGDVVVVTQKVVSKAEDRLVDIDPEVGHRPLVERESVRILRRRGDLVIAETEHGFVCANAGGGSLPTPVPPATGAPPRDRCRPAGPQPWTPPSG